MPQQINIIEQISKVKNVPKKTPSKGDENSFSSLFLFAEHTTKSPIEQMK